MQSAGVIYCQKNPFRKRLSEPLDHLNSLVLSLPCKSPAPWWSVSARQAHFRQRGFGHVFVTSEGMAGEVGQGIILPCGCVCACSWVCICACKHQYLHCFPTDLEGIEFTMCGAAFTFFTRYRQALHLLLHGFFLFRHDVSFLAASTMRCGCETGALRGLQSLGASVWFQKKHHAVPLAGCS